MKLCSKCKQLKQLNEFGNNRKKPDGKQSYCSDCSKAKDKRHYKNNDKRKLAIRDDDVKRFQRVLDNLVKYLKEHPCVDCGESDIIVLEFDHLPQYKKQYNIATMIKGCNWEKIETEIAKCEVVCANCHHKRAATRGNWAEHAFAIEGHQAD